MNLNDFDDEIDGVKTYISKNERNIIGLKGKVWDF